MFLAAAMWVVVAASEPVSIGDRTNCVWEALSPGRREALARLRYEPEFERRLEQTLDIVSAAEIEAVTAQCGAEGPEAWMASNLSILVMAERQAAEESLRPQHTPEQLAAAFAPLGGEIERHMNTGDDPAVDEFEVLKARFIDSLGGARTPADRAALGRYMEAATFGVLVRTFWLRFDAWVAEGRPDPAPNGD